MNIQSLGYRTDLIFSRFDGEVEDKDDYVVVRTPSNPSFYWGNFLLFESPPTPDSIHDWPALFAREIGTPPSTNHFAFGWDSQSGSAPSAGAWDTVDGEPGVVQPFIDAGYDLTESVVLATAELKPPPHYNRDAEIRPITRDGEWEQATANKIMARDPDHGLEGYSFYMTRQMNRYRAMVDAGLGTWFGAFVGDRLVADLGVFADSNIARYQHVDTHPDYRRRGICGTLVYEAGRYAMRHMKVDTLVMIADENYHAARIYESVGFAPVEKLRCLTWWDRSTA